MNQSSTSSDGSKNIPMYIIYIVQSLVAGGCNLVIVLCIVRYKALRRAKTYIILAGLSLSDWLDQTGFVLAGVYRLSLIVRGKHNTLVTPWECFVPQNWLWTWSNLISNLMLLVVSMDRLIAVAKPLYYLKLNRSYAFGMLGVSYSVCLCFGFGSALFFYTAKQEPSVPAICSPIGTLLHCAPSAWAAVHGGAPQAFGVASVLLYGVVWYLYKKHVNSQVNSTESVKRAADQQRRMTVSLGMSSLCTLFLAVVPMCVGYGVHALGSQKNLLLFYSSFIMSNINPFCNVLIYAMRHTEIRLALKGLFTGKVMPDNVEMWVKNTQAKSAKMIKSNSKQMNVIPAPVDHPNN